MLLVGVSFLLLFVIFIMLVVSWSFFKFVKVIGSYCFVILIIFSLLSMSFLYNLIFWVLFFSVCYLFLVSESFLFLSSCVFSYGLFEEFKSIFLI